MKLIQGKYESTIVVHKSKFIGQAFRVNTMEEIEDILNLTRKKYYDATHNCYAYRLGNHIQKMSDDGEPAKTAGAPILDVLLKQDIENILVIVTRYFGGILLGAGGLVRAYTQATVAALEHASFYQLEEQVRFKMTITYSAYQTLLKLMPYIKIEETSFLSEVVIQGHTKVKFFDKIKEDAYQYKLGDIKLIRIGVFPIEIPFDIST